MSLVFYIEIKPVSYFLLNIRIYLFAHQYFSMMDQSISFIIGSLFICLLVMPISSNKYGYSWTLAKSGTLTCIPSLLSAVKQRFNAWMFLFRGPSMIQEAYEKVIVFL